VKYQLKTKMYKTVIYFVSIQVVCSKFVFISDFSGECKGLKNEMEEPITYIKPDHSSYDPNDGLLEMSFKESFIHPINLVVCSMSTEFINATLSFLSATKIDQALYKSPGLYHHTNKIIFFAGSTGLEDFILKNKDFNQHDQSAVLRQSKNGCVLLRFNIFKKNILKKLLFETSCIDYLSNKYVHLPLLPLHGFTLTFTTFPLTLFVIPWDDSYLSGEYLYKNPTGSTVEYVSEMANFFGIKLLIKHPGNDM